MGFHVDLGEGNHTSWVCQKRLRRGVWYEPTGRLEEVNPDAPSGPGRAINGTYAPQKEPSGTAAYGCFDKSRVLFVAVL